MFHTIFIGQYWIDNNPLSESMMTHLPLVKLSSTTVLPVSQYLSRILQGLEWQLVYAPIKILMVFICGEKTMWDMHVTSTLQWTHCTKEIEPWLTKPQFNFMAVHPFLGQHQWCKRVYLDKTRPITLLLLMPWLLALPGHKKPCCLQIIKYHLSCLRKQNKKMTNQQVMVSLLSVP